MAGRGGGASLPGMDPTAVAALVAHQQQQQAPVNPQLRATLNAFWANQGQEMQRVNDFKNHNLPLARIKKIMKSDEDVRMISSEAPALFAKACEMFILELTLRSWIHSEENKRRTLQRSDLATAIARTEVYDFLIDIVPQTAEGADGDAGAAD